MSPQPSPVRAPGAPGRPGELTTRELEVVDWLAAGVTSNQDLASRLLVSENTVKYHVSRLLTKSRTRNRAQLLAWAVQHGLTGS